MFRQSHFPFEQMAQPRVLRARDSPFPGEPLGRIADSRPDAWGACVMPAEFPEITTIVGKLATIGRRKSGAITFERALGPSRDADASSVELAALAQRSAALASSKPAPLTTDSVNAHWPKAAVHLAERFPRRPRICRCRPTCSTKRKFSSGTEPAELVPRILKFSPADVDGGGSVEFAYMKMAEAARIRVPRSCLVNDGQHRHFAAARFECYIASD